MVVVATAMVVVVVVVLEPPPRRGLTNVRATLRNSPSARSETRVSVGERGGLEKEERVAGVVCIPPRSRREPWKHTSEY